MEGNRIVRLGFLLPQVYQGTKIKQTNYNNNNKKKIVIIMTLVGRQIKFRVDQCDLVGLLEVKCPSWQDSAYEFVQLLNPEILTYKFCPMLLTALQLRQKRPIYFSKVSGHQEVHQFLQGPWVPGGPSTSPGSLDTRKYINFSRVPGHQGAHLFLQGPWASRSLSISPISLGLI